MLVCRIQIEYQTFCYAVCTNQINLYSSGTGRQTCVLITAGLRLLKMFGNNKQNEKQNKLGLSCAKLRSSWGLPGS
jgi:hypothetical protein